MPNNKKMSGMKGGAILLLGSLIYLYVVFSWYGAGAPASAWLGMAQFFAPFVVAGAIISAITLFFMSLGTMSGMRDGDSKMMSEILWKFIMIGAATQIILTGGSGWFWASIVGFLLTYIGAMVAMM